MLFDGEFSLLSDEQTFGSQKIDIIRQMGTKCAITDFAILLGAFVSGYYHVDDDSSLKDRTGWWYLSSSDGDGDVRGVSTYGSLDGKKLAAGIVVYAQFYLTLIFLVF